VTDATCARLHQIIELSRKYDTHTNARIRELVERILEDEGAHDPRNPGASRGAD
jgi:hypothetical protein